MFFKMLVVSGYMFAWIGFFTVMTFILKGFIKRVDDRDNSVRLDLYMRGVVETFALNLLVSLVIVLTIMLLLFDVVHWMWVMTGVISTFVVYIVTYYYVKFGRYILEQKLTDKEKESVRGMGIQDIQNKMKVKQREYWLVYLLNILAYVVISLNAWDIIPIRQSLFPPMMPIYLHLTFDWIQIAFIFLMNFLLIIVYRKWMRYKRMEKEIIKGHAVLEKERASGN